MTNFPPTNTPWGNSDYEECMAPGIYFVCTPSHGGFWLSPERAEKMPTKFREWADKWAHGKQRYSGEWYEEDCCALAVVVTHPDLFPQADIEQCHAMIKEWME